jgi:hypothetical protein
VTFKIIKRAYLTSDGFHPIFPPQFLEAGTVVEKRSRKPVNGVEYIEVATRDYPAKIGWIAEANAVPLYGQTERKEGLVLSGNQECKDQCIRFAKKLDALSADAFERAAFMIGVLQCEDLDGKKVFYVAISGNYQLPTGWQDCAKAIGCVPAPNVKEGHSRNLSGNIVGNLNQAGDRVSAPPTGKFGALGRNAGDWDTPRRGNKPETCAAQKLIQIAIKNTDTMRNLWEQWYDRNHGLEHGRVIESCPTCKIDLPRLLDRQAQ